MEQTSFAAWREKMHMTQAEAAEAIGVGLTTVKQYEVGRHLSTGKPMSPPEPVRKVMRALANGVRVEAWPE